MFKKFISVLLATVMLSSYAHAQMTDGFDDRTVAGFVVGDDFEAKLTSLYGEGTKYDVLPDDGGASKYYARCYFFSASGNYLTAAINRQTKKIASLTISSSQMQECVTLERGKIPVATAKGVRPGFGLRQVLDLYGKPSEMFIEELTDAESTLLAKRFPPPEFMTMREYAATFTERRTIPQELSENEFLQAFGRPEQVIGVHKPAHYLWHASTIEGDFSRDELKAELIFYKGVLTVIAVTDPRR